MTSIKIGTRSSKLALWQAYHVQDLLKAVGLESELVTFETKGDKILDKSLSKIGSKGLFTQELESSLLAQETHLAVHSAKDLPSRLPEELEIIAFSEREKFHDVLVSNQAVDLTQKIRIGTSSTRRIALLKHFYPHLEPVPMRGNLQTRIAKMQNGDCDALMLAYAGVHRMGYSHLIQHHFDIDQITPPVGQGSLAIEAATSLDATLKAQITKAIEHKPSALCLMAERSFLKVMDGGCSVPIFAYARLEGDQILLQGGIISLDGQQKIDVNGSSTDPIALGQRLAGELLYLGGDHLLRAIKKTLNNEL